MRFHVVTTMNAKGWEETGRRMVESFVANWPAEAKPLTLYAEGFDPGPIEGVEVRSLPDWLPAFKDRYGKAPVNVGHRRTRYDYRYDGVKFAHKVAALTDFATDLTDGIAVWLDADTFTHAEVTVDWLLGLFPGDGYIAWLDRADSHPECGFVMYRASHPYHRAFMERFREAYETGEVFRFAESHDSFVLQQLVNAKVQGGKIPAPTSLSGDPRWHHPFVNGPLGAKLDHLKGPGRKVEGRSRKWDSRAPRMEPYWQGGT